MSSAQPIGGRTGTSPKGGERVYTARLGKGRSPCQSRHSIASGEIRFTPEAAVAADEFKSGPTLHNSQPDDIRG